MIIGHTWNKSQCMLSNNEYSNKEFQLITFFLAAKLVVFLCLSSAAWLLATTCTFTRDHQATVKRLAWHMSSPAQRLRENSDTRFSRSPAEHQPPRPRVVSSTNGGFQGRWRTTTLKVDITSTISFTGERFVVQLKCFIATSQNCILNSLCLRQEQGRCTVQYTVADTPDSFHLTRAAGNTNAASGGDCQQDFLLIPLARELNSVPDLQVVSVRIHSYRAKHNGWCGWCSVFLQDFNLLYAFNK